MTTSFIEITMTSLFVSMMPTSEDASDAHQYSSSAATESINLEYDDVTTDSEADLDRVILCIVIALLCLFSVIGAAGNALVLYVFSKKKDTLVSTQCIIALATVDFFTCLVIIPFTVYMEYADFHVSNDVCCKLYQFLITSTIPFSALIMVAIALDRYLCICHPFLRIMTVGRAKVVICALWMFAGLLGVIVALMFGVYQRTDVSLNSNTTIITDYEVSMWDRFVRNETFAIARENETNGEQYESNPREPFFGVTDGNAPSAGIINVGLCQETDILLNAEFQFYYQKLYNTIFPLCLAIVVVLYILIYRSVLVRRNRRQQQKSKSLVLVQSLLKSSSEIKESATVDQLIDHKKPTDNEGLTGPQSPTEFEINAKEVSGKEVGKTKSNSPDRRHSNKADGNRMANIKTAAMLFVVNVVFVITFMPAFLMAIKLVPYNGIVFYLYFANNVANPVIYSFMNKNFRSDLIKLFKNSSH